ncbi:hypothetical protein K443DRAFT_391182 [Laccaria amethystina LaAM-08-1]|jgi:hypothetical protein|uniref:Uncharacterized protein n=1 Tax=Laccaria amethystina LaAM-08-1 TaxID=1095629 RepID=A0A0C9YGW2_9AGAR|nr:hypothetical protein K443DRAFT_391182 [Laccaria amethystina LaAM-08-1]
MTVLTQTHHSIPHRSRINVIFLQVGRSCRLPIFLLPNVVIRLFPKTSSIQQMALEYRRPVAMQQFQESIIDVYHILRALLAPLVGAEKKASVSRTS